MSYGINALLMPIKDIIEIFDGLNEKDITSSNIDKLFVNDKANVFYSVLAKRITEYHKIRIQIDKTRRKNKIFYILAIVIVSLSAGSVLLGYIFLLARRIKKSKSIFTIDKIAIELLKLLAVITLSAFTIQTTVMQTKKMGMIDDHVLNTKFERSLLAPTLNLFNVDSNGRASGNYILYIYYKVYYDKNVYYENEDEICCECLDEDKCNTLLSFINYCKTGNCKINCAKNKSKSSQHKICKDFSELMCEIKRLFTSLNSIEEIVYSYDHQLQLRNTLNTIDYFDNLLLKKSPNQFDFDLKEVQDVLDHDFTPIMHLTFFIFDDFQLINQGKTIQHKLRKDEAILEFLSNKDYIACSYDGQIATFLSGSEISIKHVHQSKKHDKQFVSFKRDRDVPLHIQLKSTKSDIKMITRKLPKQNDDSDTIYISDHKGDKHYIDEFQLQQKYVIGHNNIDESHKFVLHTTTTKLIDEYSEDEEMKALYLEKFSDVVASQIHNLFKNHKWSLMVTDVNYLVYETIDKLYKGDKIKHVAKEIIKQAKQKYIDSDNSKEANGSYIDSDLFISILNNMTEVDFHAFCKKIQDILVSSNNLQSFNKMFYYKDDSEKQNIKIVFMTIIYLAVLILTVYGIFVINDVLLFIKDYLSWTLIDYMTWSIKHILIIGTFILVFAFLFVKNSVRDTKNKFNEDMIQKNGMNIKRRIKDVFHTILSNFKIKDSPKKFVNCSVIKDSDDLTGIGKQCQFSKFDTVTINKDNREIAEEIHGNLVSVLESLKKCNNVTIDHNVKLPFPYLSVTENIIVIAICIGLLSFIVVKFGLLTKIFKIKELLSFRSKIQRYIPVSEKDIEYYLKSTPITIEIKIFLIIFAIILFVYVVFKYTSTITKASSQLEQGLLNSRFSEERNCYETKY